MQLYIYIYIYIYVYVHIHIHTCSMTPRTRRWKFDECTSSWSRPRRSCSRPKQQTNKAMSNKGIKQSINKAMQQTTNSNDDDDDDDDNNINTYT